MKLKELWSQPDKIRRRVLAMVRKELDWFIHDKISVFILFFLPIFLLTILGNIESDIGINEPPIVYIIDQDNSTYSKDFIESFKSENLTLDVSTNHEAPETVTIDNAEELIYTKYLDAYMIIPNNFSETLLENRSSTIFVYIDAIDILKTILMKYEFRGAKVLYQVKYQIFNSEILYYPELRPERQTGSLLEVVLPLMLPYILFGVMNMVVSQALVGDIPLKRMLISPARKYEIIAAKILAYSFLGLIISYGSLILITIIFNIEFFSFINTFIITFAATFFGITFGILFSSISSSRLQAAELFLFTYIMQVLIINYLRTEPIVHFMPVQIIYSIFTDVAYRGISIFELGFEILILIIGENILIILLTLVIFYKKHR
ncbi:MAG: membrane protein of unknown function [Promethearchaeota archaeon]|nr:MAG: membrane protein of unknown function [Candidatus Lokiarchaeota archaeon]